MALMRLAEIEKVLMGLEKIDEEYLKGEDINLLFAYVEAMNSIRSILGFQNLLNEDNF